MRKIFFIYGFCSLLIGGDFKNNLEFLGDKNSNQIKKEYSTQKTEALDDFINTILSERGLSVIHIAGDGVFDMNEIINNARVKTDRAILKVKEYEDEPLTKFLDNFEDLRDSVSTLSINSNELLKKIENLENYYLDYIQNSALDSDQILAREIFIKVALNRDLVIAMMAKNEINTSSVANMAVLVPDFKNPSINNYITQNMESINNLNKTIRELASGNTDVSIMEWFANSSDVVKIFSNIVKQF